MLQTSFLILKLQFIRLKFHKDEAEILQNKINLHSFKKDCFIIFNLFLRAFFRRKIRFNGNSSLTDWNF